MVRGKEELDHLYRLVTTTSAWRRGRWALFATLGSVQAIPKEDELEGHLWGRDIERRVADLRPLRSRGVSFWVDVMNPHAIRGDHAETGRFEQLALTSPLFDANFRDAVVLPGDQILFDANQQVYALDWPTRKVAALGPASRSLEVQDGRSSAGDSRR